MYAVGVPKVEGIAKLRIWKVQGMDPGVLHKQGLSSVKPGLGEGYRLRCKLRFCQRLTMKG